MKKALYACIVIAVCGLFFYPTISEGKLPVPTDTLIGMYHPWLDQAAHTNPSGVPFKNFLITDPIRQQIPWRKLVIDQVKQGKVPLWNPYTFAGTPLLANIQAGTFYPLNALFFLLPFMWAWVLLVALQPFLAATFMAFYLRSKKLDPLVSLFGGIVWAFCGFSIAWLTWGTILQTALWLPIILLAVDALHEKKRYFAWVFVFILAVSSAFFAGHVQIALYIFLFAAVYALTRFSWKLALGVAGAILLTSVQWVPMLGFLRESSRLGDPTVWTKEGWFLPWQHLVQFVAPDFFGNPATLNYTGVWNYGEFIGYIGILPLMLALYGLFVRKDRLSRFMGVALGIVLLFVLPTPIGTLPYQLHIPLLSSLQPTRLMVLVDFCLVVLAALGLDAFIKKPSKHMMLAAGLVGLVLAGLWIFVVRTPDMEVARRNLILPSLLWVGGILLVYLLFRLPKRWKWTGVLLAVAFVVFDLFRFGWKFTPFTPQEYFFPTTKAVSFLQSQQAPYRVMSLDNRALPPNVTAYYGIETPEGYDPLYDARYEEFIAALNRNEPNITPPFGFNRIITLSNVSSPLLPLLNVKYVVTLSDITNPDLELMYTEGSTRIYFYKKALPRMYVASAVERASTTQEIFDKLHKNNTLAVVQEPVSTSTAGPSSSDSFVVESDTSARVSFSTPKFVVVSHMFSKYWKGYIDSQLTKIYRTNHIFQGIIVPAGEHQLTFTQSL